MLLVAVARRAKRLRAGLEEHLGDAVRRIGSVRGLGLLSRGPGQARGNGWLSTHEEELRFCQWLPERETRVPLVAVTAVGTERSWLGKTVGSPLLCVRWRTLGGSDDAMAWEVPDLEEWLATLLAQRDRTSG